MTEEFEQKLQNMVRDFTYPPTPKIQLRQPIRPTFRLAWVAMLVMALFFGSVLVVPPIRAFVFEILQIGAVEVTLDDVLIPENAVPSALVDWGKGISVEEAQEETEFVLRIPDGWRQPDLMYLQGDNDKIVVMVWRGESNPDEIELLLHQTDRDAIFFYKGVPELEITNVNGLDAFWLSIPHLLEANINEAWQAVLVEGNVLAWMEDGVTYRLETQLLLEDAIELAESLVIIGTKDD